MTILYVVRDEDLDILGIYEDAWDAEERTNELEAEGWQDITITDYKLNLDVELYLDTNVIPFGGAQQVAIPFEGEKDE